MVAVDQPPAWKRRLPWAVLFLTAAVLYSANLNAPFVHHKESNSTQYGFLARNVLKFGGAPRDVSGPSLEAYTDARTHAYVNRPPGVVYAIALSMTIFGDGEAAVRIVGILFGLGSLAIFALLARRLLSGRAVLVATIFLAFMPMFAYFSVASVHQAPTLFFILLMCLCYWKWRETRRLAWLIALLGAQVVGCWTDWPAYYTVLVLWLHDMGSRRTIKTAMWIPLAANFLIFGGYLLYAQAANPADGLEGLLGSAKDRSTLPGFVEYVVLEAREMGLYFTVGLLVAALGWWSMTPYRTPDSPKLFILLLPLLSLDQLFFSKECFGHDYYSYYWGPCLALSAAGFVGRLWKKRPPLRLVSILLVLMFAGQSAWIIHRRMTRVEKLDFYYHMGRAMDELTPPDARVFVAVHNLGLYTPFYADRYMLSWDWERRRVKESDTTPPIFEGPEQEVIQWVRDPDGAAATHIIWADSGEVQEWVGPLRGASLEVLDDFGIRADPNRPIHDFLRQHPFERAYGFRVTELRKP